MAAFKRYEEIDAWKLGRDLVARIYQATSKDPLKKDWGLKDQIQRSAVSICSNIAEGFGRRGNKEFANFLWIAKGSAAEVSSQLYHLKDLGHLSGDEFDELYNLTETIAAKIFYLIRYLADNIKQTKL